MIANIGGGMPAIPFAATHPERVSRLVLVDCFARFQVADDFPIGAPVETVAPLLAVAEARTGQGVMLDLFAPSVAGDERLRRAWSRYERHAATPGSTVAIVRLIYESDVRDVLPAIRAPTLVIHRATARFRRGPRPLPGSAHRRFDLSRAAGHRQPDLGRQPGCDRSEIAAFVTGVRPTPEPNRLLATVLFTDIVGPQSSPRSWAMPAGGLLGEHDDLARRQIERFGGRAVKSVGDGVLATFDGPARAVRCAAGIRDEVAQLGIDIRAGLHTGEIEVQPEDVAGLAVHIGARIAALAEVREILVSSTVRDLIVGSGLEFDERGEHEPRAYQAPGGCSRSVCSCNSAACDAMYRSRS